jgi:hypothetical protein
MRGAARAARGARQIIFRFCDFIGFAMLFRHYFLHICQLCCCRCYLR